MLLLHDDDELPASPSTEETALARKLGAVGLAAVDATLLDQVDDRLQKGAMVVSRALRMSGHAPWSDGQVELYVRRLIALVEAGALVGVGNLRKPRWSEVRRA